MKTISRENFQYNIESTPELGGLRVRDTANQFFE